MNELYLRNIVDKTPNIYKFKVLFKKKIQNPTGWISSSNYKKCIDF